MLIPNNRNILQRFIDPSLDPTLPDILHIRKKDLHYLIYGQNPGFRQFEVHNKKLVIIERNPVDFEIRPVEIDAQKVGERFVTFVL